MGAQGLAVRLHRRHGALELLELLLGRVLLLRGPIPLRPNLPQRVGQPVVPLLRLGQLAGQLVPLLFEVLDPLAELGRGRGELGLGRRQLGGEGVPLARGSLEIRCGGVPLAAHRLELSVQVAVALLGRLQVRGQGLPLRADAPELLVQPLRARGGLLDPGLELLALRPRRLQIGREGLSPAVGLGQLRRDRPALAERFVESPLGLLGAFALLAELLAQRLEGLACLDQLGWFGWLLAVRREQVAFETIHALGQASVEVLDAAPRLSKLGDHRREGPLELRGDGGHLLPDLLAVRRTGPHDGRRGLLHGDLLAHQGEQASQQRGSALLGGLGHCGSIANKGVSGRSGSGPSCPGRTSSRGSRPPSNR